MNKKNSYTPVYIAMGTLVLLTGVFFFFHTTSNQYIAKKNSRGLQEVISSGKLTVLTRNNFNTYYLGPDGPAGFEYDLIKAFADSLGVELNMRVVDDFVRIIPDLISHRADMAAASLTVTEGRSDKIAFSQPYLYSSQQIVYKNGTKKPRLIRELAGKNLAVLANSSHAENLRKIQQAHPNLSWSETGEDIETLIELIDSGRLDFTITDSLEAASLKRFYPELRTGFKLTNDEPLAWAFPIDADGSLLEAANDFLKIAEEKGLIDKLKRKYFEHIDHLDYVSTRTFMRDYKKRLPKLQNIFYSAAARYDIDWQILAAISYQESHWKTNAVSPTGVRGVMMLTRNTAKDMGIKDRTDPEQSIMGGTRYFVELKKRLPESIETPDRTWMALAAYNVGLGHLNDARKLTESMDGNPDSWANVRETLPLLSKAKWYKKTKHGYARGKEPVEYVRNIRNYYEMLIWLSNNQTFDNLEADSQDIRIEFAPKKKEL